MPNQYNGRPTERHAGRIGLDLSASIVIYLPYKLRKGNEMEAVVNGKFNGEKVTGWIRCLNYEGAWTPMVRGKCVSCGEKA